MSTHTETSLEILHDQLLDHVKKGEFAQGIEAFYAADVVQQANSDAPQSGMEALAKAEYEYQGKVTSLNKVEVLGRSINDDGGGNGEVFYEVHMNWDHQDQGKVDVQQTVVERWRDSKIYSIRFYGTFDTEK